MFRLLIISAIILSLVVIGEDDVIKRINKKSIRDRLINDEYKNESSPLNTCGGNCPSNDCSSCPCGTTKVDVDIATWCSKYTWNQKNCQCIMSHESGGDENAVNENTNGSFDVGLWQINTVNWDSCSGGKAPCDPNTNLKCAQDVYKWGGNTWKLWSTCKVCGCCSES